MLFAAGRLLGEYEILAPIGVGGRGEVYRARDRRLNRDVAIRVIGTDPDFKTIAALHHPNICTLHEIGESEGHHFLVMEYVEGRPLSRLLGGRPLAVTQIFELAIQMAGGLEEARSKGVVHRDIKPSNILVTPKGQVKILDFGLAKSVESARVTWPYMSPEQALGQSADHRSDLFSLGVVIYEMATGRRPFEGSTAEALMHEITKKAPAAPAALNPEFPGALDPVLRKMMAKDPEMRYQTAAELATELKRVRDETEPGRRAPRFWSGIFRGTGGR